MDYTDSNCLVILYYDYFLSFSLEYERFWKAPKMTGGSCLFFLVRYIPVFGHIPVIVRYFSTVASSEKNSVRSYPVFCAAQSTKFA